MNCETADSLLLDELYGELDEATSAELRRHADDCATCGLREALATMKRTREAAAPEYVEPPSDLEDRILAATREIKPVVPIRKKMGGFVSLAGAWAMRPQTAMAAVFLLMIGSSLTFLKTHRSKSGASSAVAVSEQGMPWPFDQTAANSNATQSSSTALGGKLAGMVGGAATAAASAGSGLGDDDSTDGTSVAAARHSASANALEAKDTPAPPSPAMVAMATPPESAAKGRAVRGSTLDDDSFGSSGATGGGAGSARRDKAAMKPSPDPSPTDSPYAQYASNGPSTNAPSSVAPAAAPVAAPASTATSMPATPGNASLGSALSDASGSAGSAGAAAPGDGQGSADPVTAGKAAYKAKKFAEALADFDAVASGDVNAALWAARAVRESSGCAAAVGRFDDVAARAPSSTTGYDAKLEGARCYRRMGDADSAKARLNPLLTVPSHMDRAKAELAALASPPSSHPPAAATKGARAY